MSRWIVDASLALGWYLKDEQDRSYNLSVLSGLDQNEAIVPFLWWYEVPNGLLMAHRRQRVSMGEVPEILESLRALPILVDPPDPAAVAALPALAIQHSLTVYDAGYLELAIRSGLPIASKDGALKRRWRHAASKQYGRSTYIIQCCAGLFVALSQFRLPLSPQRWVTKVGAAQDASKQHVPATRPGRVQGADGWHTPP